MAHPLRMHLCLQTLALALAMYHSGALIVIPSDQLPNHRHRIDLTTTLLFQVQNTIVLPCHSQWEMPPA